ncbi:MAG: hypothetical protein H0T54_02195, partial [Geodermatophilaceae bacterium]|nr:hypothetical protein [Geodermatophilaceae bacterium]
MRLPSRVIALAALVVVAITCTDAPTGPKSTDRQPAAAFGGARLALSPSFSPSATTAYNTLAAFALEVTRVRVVLTAADGKVVKDTVIEFPPGQDRISIELPVTITGIEQTFTALLQLLDATAQVLFSGTQQVVARSGSLPAAAPPPVEINYVGPGVNVRTVRLTPSDASIAASSGVTISASGLDSAGALVTNTPFRFTLSDAALATMAPQGTNGVTVTGTGRRGTVTITAITPTGITGTARVGFIPPPASLAVVSGGGQTVQAGRAAPAPFVVEVRASDGLPVPGVAVSFAASGT